MVDRVAGTDGARRRRRTVRAAGVTAIVAATTLGGCDLGAPPTRFDLEGGLVDVVDVDGDGHLDLVALTGDHVNVRLGDGAAGFGPPTTQARTGCGGEYVTCSTAQVTFADADVDGAIDMLEAWTETYSPPPPGVGSSWGVAAVRLNDGTGTFGAQVVTRSAPPLQQSVGTPMASFGDVTGDGVIDLLFTDDLVAIPSRSVMVRPGDGTGGFGAGVVTALPANVGGPLVEDVDLDGYGDLVIVGGCVPGDPGDGTIVGCVDVLFGDGSGSFPGVAHVGVADVEVDALTVDVVDVDGDGDLDLVGGHVGVDFDGGGRVDGLSTFLGDGQRGFGAEQPVPGPEQVYAVEAADFDGDGTPDLLAGSQGEDYAFRGRILFGDGAGGFGDAHRVGTGQEQIADVDEDGRPDLVAGGNGTVSVYLNRWDTRP
jgi:hypothetical protein